MDHGFETFDPRETEDGDAAFSTAAARSQASESDDFWSAWRDGVFAAAPFESPDEESAFRRLTRPGSGG
ncbi:MAG: hypothetical protein NXI21_10985 [Alphaproteobacteria bacterium]|nr:hypothetical protein [Alphaproteobacteria bacterium]